MRYIFFLFVYNILIVTTIKGQPTIIWAKQIGSGGEEYIMNHLTGKKGEIYIAGKTTGDLAGKNAGKNDGFLMKLNRDGVIVWKKQFGTEKDEDVLWSTIDTEGNILVTGSTTGNLAKSNSGKEDIFVVKYSNDGDLLWKYQSGSDSTDIARGICTDKSGNVYITGTTTGLLGEKSFGKSDCFVLAMDEKGKQLFVTQFGSSEDDGSVSITASKGKIYTSGTTFGSPGGKNNGFIDIFFACLESKGILSRITQYGSEGFDIPMDLVADTEGNFYICGSTSGNFGSEQAGEGDCFLLRLDENGNKIWSDQWGTSSHDGARCISITNDGYLLVSGLIHLPPADAFIVCIDSDKHHKWEKSMIGNSSSLNASGKSVSTDKNGNIIHVGLTSSSLFGNLAGVSDFYIIKLKSKPY